MGINPLCTVIDTPEYPVDAVEGQVVVNGCDNSMKIYHNGAWVDVYMDDVDTFERMNPEYFNTLKVDYYAPYIPIFDPIETKELKKKYESSEPKLTKQEAFSAFMKERLKERKSRKNGNR